MDIEVTFIFKKSETLIHKRCIKLTMVSAGLSWAVIYNGLPMVEISRKQSRNFVTVRDIKFNLLPLKHNGITIVEDKTEIVLKMNKVLLKYLSISESPLPELY
jgi:hypothetical protein